MINGFHQVPDIERLIDKGVKAELSERNGQLGIGGYQDHRDVAGIFIAFYPLANFAAV